MAGEWSCTIDGYLQSEEWSSRSRILHILPIARTRISDKKRFTLICLYESTRTCRGIDLSHAPLIWLSEYMLSLGCLARALVPASYRRATRKLVVDYGIA